MLLASLPAVSPAATHLSTVHPSYTLTTLRPGNFRPSVGGMAFLSDGRLVVGSWLGNRTTCCPSGTTGARQNTGKVYVLSGVTGDNPSVSIDTIATGLEDIMGLTVVNDVIYVSGGNQILRLNRSGNSGPVTSIDTVFILPGTPMASDSLRPMKGRSEWMYGLLARNDTFFVNPSSMYNGNLAQINPYRGRSLAVTLGNGTSNKRGSFVTRATGFRHPAGLGFGPEGTIWTIETQGHWQPTNKLTNIRQGGYYGYKHTGISADSAWNNLTESPAAVFLPQEGSGGTGTMNATGVFSNQPGQPLYLTSGPYAGQFIMGDVTWGGIQRFFVEKVNGEYQGAGFAWMGGLESGPYRMLQGPDGQIYVGMIGTTGDWSWNGQYFGLQKLKYNGTPTFEMLAVRSRASGMEIEFNMPVDTNLAKQASSYNIRTYYYTPTSAYGGSKAGTSVLTPSSIQISPNRKRVYLALSGLAARTGIQQRIVEVNIKKSYRSSTNTAPRDTVAFYTLNAISATTPFSDLAPAGLAYAQNPVVYSTGAGITMNIPTVTSEFGVTYSVASGALPGGLSLNPSTGAILGVPGNAGVFTPVIRATSAVGYSEAALTITVRSPEPAISYTPNTVSYPVASPIATLAPANTGGLVLSWSISPNLAAATGLQFNTTNGKISGTPTLGTPATDYTVTASGHGDTQGQTVVSIATTSPAPTVSYANTPLSYPVGSAITPLAKTGATGIITGYSIAPNLSAVTGLLFNPTTGLISGTPLYATSATAYVITAQGPGGTGKDTVTLSTTTPAPTVGYANTPLSYPVGSPITPLAKTGATGIITGYSIAPNLSTATGLLFNPTTGLISGTPLYVTSATAYVITAQGPGGTGKDTVTITTTTPAPTVSYADAPLAYPLHSAITPLAKTGATGIITSYSIVPNLGAVTGLLFNPTTGLISGTPLYATPATDYVITAHGPGGNGTDIINIATTAPAPTVSYANTPLSYPVGSAIAPLSKTGATGIVTGYSISPTFSVNTGLLFSTTTGRIEGTPTKISAATDYTITVQGPGGTGSDTVNIATTAVPPLLAFESDSLRFPLGIEIAAFRPANTGGPITGWAISAALNGKSLTANTGLLFNPSTGKILGTPVYVSPAFAYTVTAQGLAGTQGQDVVSIATGPVPGKRAAEDAAFSFRVTGASGYSLRLPEVDAATEKITVTFSNLSGRRIWRRSVDPRTGAREMEWDGRDAAGAQVPAGMYLVHIAAYRDGKASLDVRKNVTLDPR